MLENYNISPLRSAIVMLTNQCNCNCAYCFEERGHERMSFETAKDVLYFLHRSRSNHINFTFFGGEPMLEFENIIVPLVKFSKTQFKKKTQFSMTTNGTLFTKDKLDFLKENNISFLLSMDGGRTSQSCNRPLKDGRNSFDVIMRNIPYILELWPEQQFRETLTTYNVDSLFDDIMFFESIGCKKLLLIPDVLESWSEEKINSLQEQIKLYESYILEKFRSGIPPFLIDEYFNGFRQILTSHKCVKNKIERRTTEKCAGCNQCGFGVRGSASIDTNGDIYGCHHIKPLIRDSIFYIGNIYDGLDETRIRNLVNKYNPSEVGNEQCRECGLDLFCDGGCASNNYQISGDMNKVPQIYCIWKRTITDSAYRIMKIMSKENNQLFNSVFCSSVSRRQ